MHLLEANHLFCEIDGKSILENVHLAVDSGQFVGIIGPNGSGKSTLIAHLSQLLPIKEGQVCLKGKEMRTFSKKQLAKEMAVVPQKQTIPFEFLVKEVVEMGCFPHKHFLERTNQKDEAIVMSALEKMGMQAHADDHFHHLSGGQQQRVLIAKALAQETPLIILDEPTNHLDIKYQVEVFEMLKKLEVTVVTALHDLTMAANFCDQLYVLNEGECQYHGKPKEIMTKEMIEETFEVEAHIYDDPFAISYKKVS